MYPYEDKLLMNTAQVDPVKPDLCKFPNFSQAKAMICTLNKGMNTYNSYYFEDVYHPSNIVFTLIFNDIYLSFKNCFYNSIV